LCYEEDSEERIKQMLIEQGVVFDNDDQSIQFIDTISSYIIL